jgi:hypothetical protein
MSADDQTTPAASVAIVPMRGDQLDSAGQVFAFYERFGFEVTHDALPLVPGGPTHWGMRRLPNPAS